MRKPQVEHLWNDITLTLVSPRGAIMYHLISILFFLMTRTEPPRRRYPVIVSHIWTICAQWSSFLSLRVLTDRGSCKLPKSFCVIVCVSAVTHIRSTTQNVKYTPRGARGWGIDLSLACVIYEPSSSFRLRWPQKRNSHLLVTVTG